MNELPDEILRNIFTYFTLKERLRLEEVCQKWATIMPYNVTRLDLVDTFISQDSQKKADTFPLTNVLCSLLKRCGSHLRHVSFGHSYLLITYVVIDRISECCPNLESLDLSYCTVTESVVPSMMTLSDRLKHLNLSNTGFSIRNVDQHKDNMAILFSDMILLETLNLQKTNVHNLTSVYFLQPSLKSLNLNSCAPLRCEILMDVLMRCTFLEELRLSTYSQLNQMIVEAISCLTNLKVLELSHMAFSEIVFHVEREERLDFSVLCNLDQLEEIDFQYNNQITDKVLADICGGCANLKRLNISYCRHLTDFAPLSWLEHLEEFRSGASTISDSDIEHFIRSGKVRMLHATCCSIGERTVNLFLVNCSNLEELSLDQCDSINSDSVNVLLKNAKKLRYLSLQAADVDSVVFDDLQTDFRYPSLEIMETLDFSYCRTFGDSGILKLNEILMQLRDADIFRTKRLSIYVHQTKVSKNVKVLLDPTVIEVFL